MAEENSRSTQRAFSVVVPHRVEPDLDLIDELGVGLVAGGLGMAEDNRVLAH